MDLIGFIIESNRIEGILRGPLKREISAHRKFLALSEITIPDLEQFVWAIQPGAQLRNQLGMNVRVGSHIPPTGGPGIKQALEEILGAIPVNTPYEIHVDYENTHPFSDGNGRSGRVLWLWMMGGIEQAPLGFLHHFYYQALQAER